MQFWIFFQSGTGGDSFCNLLETSRDIETLDSHKSWRIDRYVDYSPKFWMPSPDKNSCFRSNMRFCQSSNSLNNRYRELVADQKNIVIPSHDTNLKKLHSSDCQDVLKKNQVKILLKRKDTSKILHRAITKNLIECDAITNERFTMPDESDFDLSVYFENLLDWNYVNQLARQLSIHIAQDDFYHWKQIVNQTIFYTTPGIFYYQSLIDQQGIYRYEKIDKPNFEDKTKIIHKHTELN